jgi:hypothetical protein
MGPNVKRAPGLECTNLMAVKSELSVIFMALVPIRDHYPGEFIILSDSKSSLLRHIHWYIKLNKPVGGWRSMGMGDRQQAG